MNWRDWRAAILASLFTVFACAETFGQVPEQPASYDVWQTAEQPYRSQTRRDQFEQLTQHRSQIVTAAKPQLGAAQTGAAQVVSASYESPQSSTSPSPQSAASPRSKPGADSRPLAPPSNQSASKPKSTSPFGMVLSLTFVLGLVLGAAWLLRKLGWVRPQATGLPNEVVQVVGRKAIGNRQQLLVVKFGSKVLLVNEHQGESRTLSEITNPNEVQELLEQCQQEEHSDSPPTALSLGSLFGGSA